MLRVGHVIGHNLKDGALHHFFVRIKIRSGHMEATVATARKVAVIIWNMLSKKEAYQPMKSENYLEKIRQNTIKNMKKKLQRLNISIEELATI